MKIIKAFCIICFMLLSCSADTRTSESDSGQFQFIREGCEYIYYNEYHRHQFTHKGNCKNPIHCYNPQ